MNILYHHELARLCAEMHLDTHVITMILETCQILCSAHHTCFESSYTPCYKLTHKNHPCCIWARQSKGNYEWLCELGLELCKEYTYRYGKVHKCELYIQELAENVPPLPDIGFTSPAQAMPDEYKDEDSVVAYRHYYFFDKDNIHSWKGKINGRDEPYWITDMRSLFV